MPRAASGRAACAVAGCVAAAFLRAGGLRGAEGRRQPVEEDREDHDGEAGLEAEADVDAVEARDDLAAEAAGADHAGDDDHRERQHDDLVDAGHDASASRAAAGSGAGCGHGDEPKAWPASTTSLSTPRMPSSVSRTPGASAKMIVATMPGTTPTRNRISAGIR